MFLLLTLPQVTLENYDAKHAQFRMLPRYKVKSEGEVVDCRFMLFNMMILPHVGG